MNLDRDEKPFFAHTSSVVRVGWYLRHRWGTIADLDESLGWIITLPKIHFPSS